MNTLEGSMCTLKCLPKEGMTVWIKGPRQRKKLGHRGHVHVLTFICCNRPLPPIDTKAWYLLNVRVMAVISYTTPQRSFDINYDMSWNWKFWYKNTFFFSKFVMHNTKQVTKIYFTQLMAKVSSCAIMTSHAAASTIIAVILYMHMYVYMYYLFMHIDRKLHLMSTMIVFTRECMKLSCLIFDNANVSIYT